MTSFAQRVLLTAITMLSLLIAPVFAMDDIADRVVVKKSERKLFLISGEQVIRSYDIALGLVPVGEKVREGDFKTPEGDYLLTNRLLDSKYFLAIQISYPGPGDIQYARRLGVRPGGQIMIHGQPNEPKYSGAFYEREIGRMAVLLFPMQPWSRSGN